MPQDWSWILIIAVLVICCGGMMFGMRRMGRRNVGQKRQTPNAEREDRPSPGNRDARQ